MGGRQRTSLFITGGESAARRRVEERARAAGKAKQKGKKRK